MRVTVRKKSARDDAPMNNEELREWIGLKPADLLVYAAIAALVGMLFSVWRMLDIGLAVLAVGCCIAACALGMKADPRLSRLTNLTKKLTYPAFLIGALVFVFLFFFVWQPAG